MNSLKVKERGSAASTVVPSQTSRASRSRRASDAVVACVASSALVLGWLHLFFLQPLGQEAIEMHQRQLDPTQIVVIPYDATRLFLFVSCSVFARGVLFQSRHPVVSLLVRLGTDTAVVMAVMILCGASPIADLTQTACAAVYLALLATTHPPQYMSASETQPNGAEDGSSNSGKIGNRNPELLSLIERLAEPQMDTPDQRRNHEYERLVSRCVVGLNIPFSVLRLYDRGWQWQRWPVPVVVASTYGWVLAGVLGLVLTIWHENANVEPTPKELERDRSA